jgi:hypothetical protein
LAEMMATNVAVAPQPTRPRADFTQVCVSLSLSCSFLLLLFRFPCARCSVLFSVSCCLLSVLSVRCARVYPIFYAFLCPGVGDGFCGGSASPSHPARSACHVSRTRIAAPLPLFMLSFSSSRYD